MAIPSVLQNSLRGAQTEKELPGQNLSLAGDRSSQVSLISTSLWIQFSWFPMVIVFKMTVLLKQNYISFPSQANSWAPLIRR